LEKYFLMVEKKYFLDFGALEKKFWAFCGIEGKFFFLKKGFCRFEGKKGAKSEKKVVFSPPKWLGKEF